MAREIEAIFLDINTQDIEKRLESLGATKEGEYLYKSRTFDYPGFPLDKKASWVRLRDEENRITLTYKKRLGIKAHDGTLSDTGMEEIEIVVSDYEVATKFLYKLGLILKFEQEKKRIRWKLNKTEFDIDTWPKLNTYLEIEAESEKELNKAIKMICLDIKDKKVFSATQVYALNGIRDKDYIKMTFDEFVLREK